MVAQRGERDPCLRITATASALRDYCTSYALTTSTHGFASFFFLFGYRFVYSWSLERRVGGLLALLRCRSGYDWKVPQKLVCSPQRWPLIKCGDSNLPRAGGWASTNQERHNMGLLTLGPVRQGTHQGFGEHGKTKVRLACECHVSCFLACPCLSLDHRVYLHFCWGAPLSALWSYTSFLFGLSDNGVAIGNG